MLTRRGILMMATALAVPVTVTSRAMAQEANGGPPPPPANAQISGVTALTQVFGDGQRLVAVALAYDRPIRNDSILPEAFQVEGRTVTAVYASPSAGLLSAGQDGNFVIVELSPDDPAALMQVSQGRDITRVLPMATVLQTGTMTAVEGSAVPPVSAPLTTTTIRNLVVDDFVQHRFEDPETGIALSYNLFIPPGFQPGRAYPLVLFMHDAGVTGPVVDSTLVQGLGAVAFAGAADQARNPAFVLAPQYDVQIANDQSQTTPHMDATVHLVKALVAQYGLDEGRIYATGQSGGGMTAIAMNLKYPDLLAASLLVACQWDPALCAPLAKKKLWVVVSEGDTKAFPGQTAIMDVIEATGAKVSRATWDGRSSSTEFAALLAEQEAAGHSINMTAFAAGSVARPGDSGGAVDHRGTWRIAYGIEGLRDWLLRQHL